MDKTDLNAGPAEAGVDRADVLAAARRIAADVRHTPLWRLPGRALGLDVAEVWLKLEHLQASGSFKARGMFNRLRSAQVPEAGVVIASGGNAGIAAAHAARALGVRCEVFLPEVATPAKRARLAGLGAQVTVEGAVYPEALAACLRRQAQTGSLLMHAYDQPEVVAGAGTLGVEIDADAGVPDRVLVSVGGGGLVAGLAAWYAGRCRIDALEPSRAPTLHAARAAGAPVDVEVGGVAADSLGARRIGAIAWALQAFHSHSSQKSGSSGLGLLHQISIEHGAAHDPEGRITRQDRRNRVAQAPGEAHLVNHRINGRAEIEGKQPLHRGRHATTARLGSGKAGSL
jgi:threonine dehydratase